MNIESTMVLFAIVAALGVVTVVAVDTILSIPEAEAGCERGNAGSHAFNQSKGKCFDRGTF
jgi:hypothetical protein